MKARLMCEECRTSVAQMPILVIPGKLKYELAGGFPRGVSSEL